MYTKLQHFVTETIRSFHEKSKRDYNDILATRLKATSAFWENRAKISHDTAEMEIHAFQYEPACINISSVSADMEKLFSTMRTSETWLQKNFRKKLIALDLSYQRKLLQVGQHYLRGSSLAPFHNLVKELQNKQAVKRVAPANKRR